jgi:copper oxidase (laccase) domain-containing protein
MEGAAGTIKAQPEPVSQPRRPVAKSQKRKEMEEYEIEQSTNKRAKLHSQRVKKTSKQDKEEADAVITAKLGQTVDARKGTNVPALVHFFPCGDGLELVLTGVVRKARVFE